MVIELALIIITLIILSDFIKFTPKRCEGFDEMKLVEYERSNQTTPLRYW